MANVDSQNEDTVDSVKQNSSSVNCVDHIYHGACDNTNCLDVNGVCDRLPNNNDFKDVCLPRCNSDKDCLRTSTNNDVMSAQTTLSTLGGSNTPSQQSETLSFSSAGYDVSHSKEELLLNEDFSAAESSNEHKEVLKADGTLSSDSDINNGTIKKSSKKLSKSSKKHLAASRGRPRKTLIPMYHSQISGDKDTIKIRIKKNLTAQVQFNPNKKKSGRRKRHKVKSDADTSDYERSNKYRKLANTKVPIVGSTTEEPNEQSVWGQSVPYEVLHRIFLNLCVQEGCLPVLVKLCKVCKLWRDVALSPSLWYKIDLNWVREKFRSDMTLHWLIHNRLTSCRDLSIGEWKVRNVQLALETVSKQCSELRGLNLSGWKGLNADHLKNIASDCSKLERLDLSSINSTSTINCQPLMNLAQMMCSRLTHLNLAHNKISGFSQIMSSISSNCPNLQLLDISNIRTLTNVASLNVEKLQIGCPKLRVLRITNSYIILAPAILPDQMASPGFPMLEELSVAGKEKLTTSYAIDDDGVERLLKNSNKLRLLDVRGCIRLSDSGLVRVPAWDLEHLFLSGCCITRAGSSALELLVQKWSHSLVEVDLAWSTATAPLDAAVAALAEKGAESPLRIINLCGSSVSLEPVKAILTKCPNLHSINLQSCRALPRGIKRLYTGNAVAELRLSFQEKPKTESGDAETEPPPAEDPLVF